MIRRCASAVCDALKRGPWAGATKILTIASSLLLWIAVVKVQRQIDQLAEAQTKWTELEVGIYQKTNDIHFILMTRQLELMSEDIKHEIDVTTRKPPQQEEEGLVKSLNRFRQLVTGDDRDQVAAKRTLAAERERLTNLLNVLVISSISASARISATLRRVESDG